MLCIVFQPRKPKPAEKQEDKTQNSNVDMCISQWSIIYTHTRRITFSIGAKKKKKTALYSNSRWLTLSSFIFYE